MNATTALDDGGNKTDVEKEGAVLYVIILPVIVIFGLCGNVISLVTIFHSRLREISANLYLIALTTADSVFLLGLLLILFKLDFIAYQFCVVIEYILSPSSYISSWSIAALTIERYLAIAHPLKHVMYGHVDRWKMMLCWLPIPFAFNLIQFISLIPYDDKNDPNYPNIRKCVPYDGSIQIVVEVADVILCYVAPCFCVVILNLLVAGKVKRSFSHVSNRSCTTNASVRRRQGSTMILLVVPVVYIILNTPFYLLRITDTIALYIFKSNEFSIVGGLHGTVIIFLYNTAHYLYYINFACDVIVYAFSSSNFRKTAVIAWRQILCSHGIKKQKMTNERERSASTYRLTRFTGENSTTVRLQ